MPVTIQSETLWFLNTLVVIRVAHTAGADTLSVLEHWAPAGDSPPLHVHHREDELFHVLEGEFRFRVADQEHRLSAGAWFLAQKGVPHTYRIDSPTGGHWLTVTSHSDFERFVRAAARAALSTELPPPSGPPTAAQAADLAALAATYEIEIVGPPLS